MNNADANSAELLNVELLRDKNHILYFGELVNGAKAMGFAWLDMNERHWTDGLNQYKGADLFDQKVRFFPEVDRDLSLSGNEYFLDGKKIEGWSSLSHQQSNIHCIEDSQYYYTCFTHSNGAILVWPKTYSNHALAHYKLDKNSDTWSLVGAVPLVASLDAIPQGTIITREEFDTLFDSINPSAGYEDIESVFTEPDFVVTRWRDARSLNIKGDVNYGAMWYGDMECNETVTPTRTPAIYQQIRVAINRMLNYESPISFATLNDLVERLPTETNVYVFSLKNKVNGIEIEANMDVQSGVDSVRGVWIDAKINEQVLRMMVTEENDFLSGMCYTGPLSVFKQLDYDGFEAEGWTAERRILFRQLIAEFLENVPAVRVSKGKKPFEPQWANPCIAGIVDLIAPQLNKAKRKQLVNTILDACNAEVPEHLTIAGGDYATPEGVAWETLLEVLESEELLVTFDKDNPFAAVGLCNQLAGTVGFKDEYEPSEDENGESFYTIARDFDRWLAPQGYCLIWPQNSLSTSGDDCFPAVIAPTDKLGAINEQLAALGGYRRFLYTSKY